MPTCEFRLSRTEQLFLTGLIWHPDVLQITWSSAASVSISMSSGLKNKPRLIWETPRAAGETARCDAVTAQVTVSGADSSKSRLPTRCLWRRNSGIRNIKRTVDLYRTRPPPSFLPLRCGCGNKKNPEPEMINSWGAVPMRRVGGVCFDYCFQPFPTATAVWKLISANKIIKKR